MLTSQFFCLSLISTAMNKAPRLYNLSTLSLKCSGVGGGEKKEKKKKKASRHRSGGAGEGFLRLL